MESNLNSFHWNFMLHRKMALFHPTNDRNIARNKINICISARVIFISINIVEEVTFTKHFFMPRKYFYLNILFFFSPLTLETPMSLNKLLDGWQEYILRGVRKFSGEKGHRRHTKKICRKFSTTQILKCVLSTR